MEYLKLLKLDIERQLKELKTYSKLRDVDCYGNGLMYNTKLEIWVVTK